MKNFVGAIDQGTSSTRFIIFGRDGQIVAMAQREHAQHMPAPGLVEHDPAEILANTRATIAEALQHAGLAGSDLHAVGITNQRETTVLWDRRTGTPLHRALVWQDTRVDDLVRQYAQDGGHGRFRAQTGLPLASYFSALKLQWLLDHVPDARAMAEAGDALFGTIDAWLIWNLCGRHVTDVTNASRTQLMDIGALTWSPALLKAFRIPAACLPAIGASSMVHGEGRFELAGVPVAGILGDQQAALVGQACFAPGEAKNTYGTGNFLLMNTGTAPKHSTCGLITTLAYRFGEAPACYALEGSIAITGALVQWLRDNLGIIASAAEVNRHATSVPDNGGVYIVPAFSGLYAPYWRADARGIIAGLTRHSHRGHLCRAALEATAYQTRDVVEAMAQDSGIRLRELRVDGGMVQSELLMQFQADILGVPVVRPAITETTALGAAYAAGLATGFWPDLDALGSHWRQNRCWTPAMDELSRARLYTGWKRAVDRSLGWQD
jgi:glycerol kinase